MSHVRSPSLSGPGPAGFPDPGSATARGGSEAWIRRGIGRRCDAPSYGRIPVANAPPQNRFLNPVPNTHNPVSRPVPTHRRPNYFSITILSLKFPSTS